MKSTSRHDINHTEGLIHSKLLTVATEHIVKVGVIEYNILYLGCKIMTVKFQYIFMIYVNDNNYTVI